MLKIFSESVFTPIFIIARYGLHYDVQLDDTRILFYFNENWMWSNDQMYFTSEVGKSIIELWWKDKTVNKNTFFIRTCYHLPMPSISRRDWIQWLDRIYSRLEQTFRSLWKCCLHRLNAIVPRRRWSGLINWNKLKN